MGKDWEMVILQNHHPIINTLGYYFLQEHIEKFDSPSYQFEPLLAMDHLLVLVIDPMQPDLQLVLYLSHLLLLPHFLLHPHFFDTKDSLLSLFCIDWLLYSMVPSSDVTVLIHPLSAAISVMFASTIAVTHVHHLTVWINHNFQYFHTNLY